DEHCRRAEEARHKTEEQKPAAVERERAAHARAESLDRPAVEASRERRTQHAAQAHRDEEHGDAEVGRSLRDDANASAPAARRLLAEPRSEEHTSELQSQSNLV